MATHEIGPSATGVTGFGALLLAATLILAAIFAFASARDSSSGPASGSPAELIAEKERALAAQSGELSLFERIGERMPDIGAASHPGLLLGLGMAAAGAGYLALYTRRRAGTQSASFAVVRGAAVLVSLLLVVIGPLLSLVSYIGIGGE